MTGLEVEMSWNTKQGSVLSGAWTIHVSSVSKNNLLSHQICLDEFQNSALLIKSANSPLVFKIMAHTPDCQQNSKI